MVSFRLNVVDRSELVSPLAMKDYRPGRWGVAFIFSCEGSVIPRALCVAIPNALLAVAIWYCWRKVVDPSIFEDAKDGTSIGQVWTGYNWVLGFTVSFRAQRAYARWWEGGTLLQQARGEWFNAYSSLIAFCTGSDAKRNDVNKFQQLLARLMSMLYASALMSIATEPDLDFEIIDASGMDTNHIQYLQTQPDKCEIIMQWIQRLIVNNMGNGVLPIPPPVISRVFQELSRGIVNIHNVRKITEFQFPFPAAQMIVVMLLVQWILTPVVTGLHVGSPAWSCCLSFFPIFACWGINYLAGELEQPFGIDYNDMPLHFMQASMNMSLLALLDADAQNPPELDVDVARINLQTIYDPGKACVSYQNLQPMRSVRNVTEATEMSRRRTNQGKSRKMLTTLPGFSKTFSRQSDESANYRRSWSSAGDFSQTVSSMGGMRSLNSEPALDAHTMESRALLAGRLGLHQHHQSRMSFDDAVHLERVSEGSATKIERPVNLQEGGGGQLRDSGTTKDDCSAPARKEDTDPKTINQLPQAVTHAHNGSSGDDADSGFALSDEFLLENSQVMARSARSEDFAPAQRSRPFCEASGRESDRERGQDAELEESQQIVVGSLDSDTPQAELLEPCQKADPRQANDVFPEDEEIRAMPGSIHPHSMEILPPQEPCPRPVLMQRQVDQGTSIDSRSHASPRFPSVIQ